MITILTQQSQTKMFCSKRTFDVVDAKQQVLRNHNLKCTIKVHSCNHALTDLDTRNNYFSSDKMKNEKLWSLGRHALYNPFYIHDLLYIHVVILLGLVVHIYISIKIAMHSIFNDVLKGCTKKNLQKPLPRVVLCSQLVLRQFGIHWHYKPEHTQCTITLALPLSYATS